MEKKLILSINNKYGDNYLNPLCYPDIEFDQGHALYVFGSPAETNEHVCVDAISGEVFVLEIKDF